MCPESCNYSRFVTHECMSSIFEVLFLFWFAVLSLLSSLDEMDVCVELLADDVWASEDDKTGFFSFEVHIFDPLYLKERPISLPMVPMSTINLKYEKWGQLWKINKSKYEILLWTIKVLCFVIPPY